jgi:hypothetical protein
VFWAQAGLVKPAPASTPATAALIQTRAIVLVRCLTCLLLVGAHFGPGHLRYAHGSLRV